MAEQKNIALITFTPNYFAFGLRSIDVYLRSLGHNVISVHASSSHRNQNSPLSTYQLDLLAGKCKDCDVIGISVISVHSIQRVRQVCFFLKNNTKAKIVLGGVPVIISPEVFLEFADNVCLGEGETFFREFLESDDHLTVPGLGYRSKTGEIILNKRPALLDVDQLPVQKVDFENTYFLFDNTIESLAERPEILYSQCHKKGYRVMRIRGCPHSCTYCCNNELNRAYKGLGKIVRASGVNRVIEELEYAKKIIPGLKKIYFLDDDFTAQSAEDFSAFITEYKKRIDLPIWEFSCTFASLSESKLEMLLKNKIEIEHIRLGIQAANKRINRHVYGRFFDKDAFIDKIELLLRHDIKLFLDIILNNPYEKIPDWVENISFFEGLGQRIKNKNLSAKLIVFIPFNLKYYPGTEIYRRALKDKIIDENYIDRELAATHYGEFNDITVHAFLLYTYKLLVNSKWKAVCRIIKKPRVLYFLDAICSIKLTQFILSKLLLIKRKGGKFFKLFTI